jgi:hypothetical protein
LNGHGVMVAVDLGDGEPLEIGAIDEKDMPSVLRWLTRIETAEWDRRDCDL